MFATILREVLRNRFYCERQMSTHSTEDIPFMQRLYNRIWLLAVLAMIFFIVVYVGWGVLDIVSVPTGPR